jgi:hypothetical protein
MTAQYCEQASKTAFSSKHLARRALVGHRGGKTMRVYQCEYDRTHYHVTKEWSTKHVNR